ncbi:MAG: GH25 family lysozyme, partial [Marmoricola sp.]
MFSKLIATASLSAVAIAGLATPAIASSPKPAPATKLPTPSAKAKADGVQPGNAPMNWQRAGSSTTKQTAAAPLARTSTMTASAATATSTELPGIDMASYAGSPSASTWSSYASKYKFVFIKSTEGTYYTSPNFSSQYAGATAAGMMR